MRADVVAHRSVTAVSAGRLNRGDGVQIEIDHVLKRRRGGAVAQAFRQGFKPRGALGLNRDHLDQRIVPALASTSPRRLRAFNGERSLSRPLSGAMTGQAFRGGGGQASTVQRWCARWDILWGIVRWNCINRDLSMNYEQTMVSGLDAIASKRGDPGAGGARLGGDAACP